MISPAVMELNIKMAPLKKWLGPHVEDLAVNRPDEVCVYEDGRWTCHDTDLPLKVLQDIATLAGALRKQDVDERNPLCATKLPGGERLQICLPPVAQTGTVALSLRRPSDPSRRDKDLPLFADPEERYDTVGWNEWPDDGPAEVRVSPDRAGLLDIYDNSDLYTFLRAAVPAGLNMLAVGETGAGKTTLFNDAATAIGDHERVITIEDTEEFTLRQRNVLQLVYSEGDLNGTGIYPEHLIKVGLRMRPNRLIIQELRDPEATWAWVAGAGTGHQGSLTTVHARSAAAGLRSVFRYCKGSREGGRYDDDRLLDYLSDIIDVIIPLERISGQVRPKVNWTWFVDAARRKGQTLRDLMKAV